MVFRVQILGSGSAMPKLHRNPSAQYVNVLERHLLIDCAEGTQMQMQKFRVKPQRIQHIMISHMHGDHYLGLVGLLSTMHLLGRKKPIHIYGPVALRELVNAHLYHGKTTLAFDLIFHDLTSDNSELIYKDKLIEIWTIPLEHRIYCNGFLIKEKEKPRKISKEAIKKYDPPISMMHRLVNGEDWVKEDGSIIRNELLTEDPPPPRTYAYCSDTRYSEQVAELIKGSDLLYHEATFLKNLEGRAKKTYHSTAEQAARIAKLGEVKKLIIGHFSARYNDVELFKEEAQEVFEQVEVVNDGDFFDL